jgi:mannose-1-phosphate guanylyltransferase
MSDPLEVARGRLRVNGSYRRFDARSSRGRDERGKGCTRQRPSLGHYRISCCSRLPTSTVIDRGGQRIEPRRFSAYSHNTLGFPRLFIRRAAGHSVRQRERKKRGNVRQMAETWAIILAGGEGSRLHKITTTDDGLVIPKQYCSLERSSCLLQDALARAASVALPSHICAVVAAQHRRWWISAVAGLNDANVFVQPQNKGTAWGILLALLTMERRNPGATLILLPADHYFRDESTFTRVLRSAGNLACANTGAMYLLGAEPESPDPELGYILSVEKALDKPASITGFTEKPSREYARELISTGALWNLFVFVGSVSVLLQLYADKHASAVCQMRKVLERHAAGQPELLDKLYDTIEPIDFSRDILEAHANRLQVIRVPHCGWTDLGTPERVEATVRSIEVRAGLSNAGKPRDAPLFFNLGAQYS